ncbi:histidine kinase dimerization/phospho-acceptor domain-containing protein [uncultured Clostridium sp.]|uniref:histidine kinase dimerization/phospho-acceptor domain-containing protein n=1 Tax=uncultured Clostridium sp. TaxID=59620 RepID=UPI00261964F3|nr:histidine kinase dimerization/phospho-acceptor domain-containing protein [uncultured Clostridium sp.]
MEINKEVYKRRSIIVTLLIVLMIFTASFGMCKSYKKINDVAKDKKANYFNEYGFADTISESSYALYYDSIKENEKQSASEILIDLEQKTEDLNLEFDIQDELSENINIFNRRFLSWNKNLKSGNLKYYYYNLINGKSYTTLNGDIKFENNNFDSSSINKDEYQFYAEVKFDSSGNLSVGEVIGADKEKLKFNIETSLINIRKDNSSSYHDYSEGYFDIEVKPITDITFIYAVPKAIKFSDSIKWGIENADLDVYQSMGAATAFAIAGVIVLIALIFPINKVKFTGLFKKLNNIPFEIWIIIVGFAIVALGALSGQLVRATLNGDLQSGFKEIIPSLAVSDKIIWTFNFIIWTLTYSVVFFFILNIKYIFNVGLFNYIKTRTIFGKVIMFGIRIIKSVLDEVTKVDLSEKNNKLIIKLLAINGAILLIITSIWFFGIPVVILYSVVLFFVIRRYVDKISEKYSKLREATSKIAEGNLDVKIEEDLGLFEPFKSDLEKIQQGFKKAVNEEVKSQKMKTDLISNVSHDLKTPLTAIITYIDLLKDENLSEEKRNQYTEILDKKAQRLQVLIEDLFEMSRASSGNINLNIEDVDVVSLMKQTILELEDKIEEANLVVRKNMPEGKVILHLDSQRTFRVFENLVINMTKYAMPNTRVFIDIIENEEQVEIIMKNMAAEEITFNVDTIAERFVRGDESRNTEGSGLGLAIAKSFVELQGGTFNISVDGDLFKVKIKFLK